MVVNMIEVQNLTKRYGAHCAVQNISFQVDEGERALHVFATYTLQLRDVEETELMQILSQEVGLSG